MLQERKFNLMSEFAILAEYDVISKFLYLIRKNKLLTNSSQLNNSVFKFIKRVTDLLQAEWIFFQVDFLKIFHEIISNEEIRNSVKKKKKNIY